jgi:type III secretion protein C
MTFSTEKNMARGKFKNDPARHAMGALRRFTAVALLGCSALLGGAVLAAPIPFEGRQVDLTAREQPIGLFFQDFFSGMDLPVSVSPSVKGAINGTFRGSAEQMLGRVLRSFGLMTYYDGSVVHVYTPDEIGTRMFTDPVGGAASVIAMARDMQLTDARNTLRSNRNGALVATGCKRFVEMVAELASGQHGQTGVAGPLGFKVYYLHYAWAQDVATENNGKTTVVPGVASLLRALVTSSQRIVQTTALTQSRGGGEQSLRNQGLARQQSTLGARGANPAQPSAETVQQAWGNRPGGVQAGAGAIDAQWLDNLNAAAAMASDARVEADSRLNAVIVRDAPGRLPYYDELVKALDAEPQAVEIEATIIELSTNKMRQLGINWRGTGNRYSFLFGDGTSNDTLLNPHGSAAQQILWPGAPGIPPQVITVPGTPATAVQDITPSGVGGFLSLVLGGGINKLAARISALQDQGVARIVTSPQVMTLSNVEAVIDTNQSFYVRVAGRQEVDLFKVSAGTTLRVTPHVFREGQEMHIKLLVQIDDGRINNAQQVDSIPQVQRSSINTQALLMAGESLLIGGMVSESESDGTTKVPLLGDIPVFGNLFKTTTTNHDRVERLFLISPRLLPARRVVNAPIPIAPQRPGSAVEPPPMPKQPEPPWKNSESAPASSDQPAPSTPVSDSPESSDSPASSTPASGGDTQ